MRISDWSSDVCSSDLLAPGRTDRVSGLGDLAFDRLHLACQCVVFILVGLDLLLQLTDPRANLGERLLPVGDAVGRGVRGPRREQGNQHGGDQGVTTAHAIMLAAYFLDFLLFLAGLPLNVPVSRILPEIGRASCRERVSTSVIILLYAVTIKKN